MITVQSPAAPVKGPAIHSQTEAAAHSSLDLERKFLVLVGSAFLVQEQLTAAENTATCSLCNSEGLGPRSLKRMRRTARVYQKMVQELMSEKKRKTKGAEQVRKRCREWMTHEMKRGRVKTLRRQKEASIITQQCVSCGEGIQVMSRFLKRVDKLAQSMQSGLHTHNSSRMSVLPTNICCNAAR